MTTGTPQATQATQKSGKWIPYYFVAFFVTFIVVDAVMVYLATSTQTGVVTEDAYEKGLDYDRVVAAEEAQKALGWQSNFHYTAPMAEVSLKDASGAPLDDARVEVFFSRPTQDGYDFSVVFPASAAGHYAASVDFPLKGQWDATITVLCQQQNYQNRQRIVVP